MTQALKEVTEQYIKLGETEGIVSKTNCVVDKGDLEKMMRRSDFSMAEYIRDLAVTNWGKRIIIDGVQTTLEVVGGATLMTLNEALNKRGRVLDRE